MKSSFMLALVLATSTAHADDLTLDGALTLFREHSPQVAVATAGIGVAAADLVQADIYPNPEVGLSSALRTQGDTAGADQQYELDLSVPLLIGRQRHHRREAADAHVGQARAEAALTLAEAELDVRARFAALLAAQEQTQVLEASLADTKTLRDIVAGRTSAGAGSPYALERIDLAIATLTSRVDAAHADEAAAAGDLSIALGLPELHAHAVGSLATEPPSPPTLAADHPGLALDRAAAISARADEEAAHADAVPTPSLGVQAAKTAGPSGVQLSFGLSVPLAFFDRNQGVIARARAAAHRADAELTARQALLAASLDRATRVLAARRDAQSRFQSTALQRVATVRSMAEASYRSGQGTIVELLDALDAITDARLRDIDLRLAIASADLDVRRAAQGR